MPATLDLFEPARAELPMLVQTHIAQSEKYAKQAQNLSLRGFTSAASEFEHLSLVSLQTAMQCADALTFYQLAEIAN